MSVMPVELFIALRYLKARKKSLFSFTTTLIAIGGTSLGVAALVITLEVMSGFQNDIKATNITSCTITHTGNLST